MGKGEHSLMVKTGPYRRKFHSTLFSFILLTSAILIPLSLLVRITWSQPPWWNEHWNFRKQIIIDHTKVMTDLQNFPILIDIVDPDLKTKIQLGGHDITFTIDHVNTLNHEIELYDSNSGHLVAWLHIPLLSSTADTELYMYYGNPNAANLQNPSAVWDANFVLVQHLEETSTSRYDSTINANNGTAYGGIVKSNAGKVDGADVFDGTNDYISVSNSLSLNPSSAFTIETWMNLTTTGAYIGLISKGTWSQYFLRLGSSEGRAYWFVKFSDGTAASVEGSNIGWKWNTWHHIVATADTQARVIKVYLDGVQKLSSTFAAGKTIISTSNPLLISEISQRRVKGIVDEVRVSNVARLPEWIQTSYNNQKNPTAFYTIGGEETYSLALLIFENPKNEAMDAYTNPALSVRVMDPENGTLTVILKEKVADSWIDIGTYENVPSGTYSAMATQMKNLGNTYYWGVAVNDGETWTNRTFSLTTTTKTLVQKWMTKTGFRGVSGVLAADVNGDGKDEVIYAGKGGVGVHNGTEGGVIWSVADSGIGDHAQPQMADLNNDGILEIIVPLESPTGLLVLRANSGSTYWRLQTGLGGSTYSSPVIFDIDGNGYPTIFIGSTDTSNGLDGTGRVSAVSYEGIILYQAFSWRPCSGGLSIADTNWDGEFELYMGERNMYLNDPEYGDNDYGKGVVSFWAKNLSLRWYRPEIFCSSQIPMIADVNKDGTLDIIIGDLDGGLAVLNATDGSTIKMTRGIPQTAPTHYQPSIYDIDGDGNLEMLMADPHDTTSDDLVVWDLVKWQVDARIYLGKNFYGPQVADVTGDGIMEIIACNYKSILIVDKAYRVIDGVVGLSGDITDQGEIRNIDGISMLVGTLNYAVAQDVDGDDYLELIVSTQSGDIYAFDTPARRPNPRPRTEVQFYSEFRLGAAEYVLPQGGPEPTISYPSPLNLATDVPITLTQLNFTLVDFQLDPMNYTVTTYPDIGSASEINKGNGMRILPVSNLQYSKTYTWTITVTDGTHWKNATYTFTTETFSPWWDNHWQYRKPITIDQGKVVADQDNFPLLIDITDSDLRYKAQVDGDDIVFTDKDSNKLAHEIEHYNSDTGQLVAWVRIPSVSSKADTKIYMYYNNSDATNQQNSSGVWDSNFKMIQHLEEISTNRYDSTSNGNTGVAYGGIVKSVAGKIDGTDVFDGTDDYVRMNDSPSLNPSSAITIELWIKLSSTGSYINLVSKGTYSQYYLRLGSGEGSTYWFVKFSDGTVASVSGSNIGWKWNTWHHLAATVDTETGTMKVYLDGVQKLSSTFAAGKIITSTSYPLLISEITQRRIKGEIDEVRVSNVARLPQWIQTSYNNQKDPATFCVIRNEETIPEAPLIFSPSPLGEATNISPFLSELSFNITDYQNNINYTVTTNPDIGSGSGINVPSDRYVVPVSGLQYSNTYSWSVTATDGTNWTNKTFTFTTLITEPPTQSDPTLLKSGSNIVCYNQTTHDPDGDQATNTYNWYRNGVSTTNLLMTFNTRSSTTVKDYSGYDNQGTVLGGATWIGNGKVGGAYNFNRGFIQIPGADTLDGGGAWSEITVEHWIYLTATQSNTRTIARIPSYEIGISANKIFASIWTDPGDSMVSGYNQISYNTTLQTNTWYHVVLTYKKGVALTLYVNGALVATKTPSESTTLNFNIQPSGTINPLYIGWFDYFKGMIDEVNIYPRSLSQQQINQHYLETTNGLSNSSTIVSQETSNGETWRCEVTPNDSHQDGATKTSNTVTIGVNNPPLAKDVVIIPALPKTSDDLTATYTYFDPEGNPESGTEIRWYKNGELQPLLNNTYIIPASETTKGDQWHFTVKPKDGTTFGTIQTSPEATILNTAPSIENVLIFPDPAYENDTLTATPIGWSDPDGDPEGYVYQWQKYVNETWQDIQDANSQTLEPQHFQAGDSIRVWCTPYDGQTYGTPKNDPITITNN